MDKPRVLMKDVAKVAGVHQTTVSLALRNHPSLPQATRDRIQKLANEMGYRPDPALSALVAYRQATKNQPSEQVIAWIINVKDDRINQHHVHRLLLAGAKERAQELGYKLDIFWLGKEYKDSKSLNRVLKARGIQGVIFGAFDYHEEPFELDWDLFSCIKVNPLPEDLSFDTVLCDQIDAVGQVIADLHRVGIKRFGLAVSEFEEIHKRFTFAAGFHTHRREVAPENWVPPFYFQHGADYKEDVIPSTLEWARENKLEAIISNWNNLEEVARRLHQEGQECRFVSLDADEHTARHGGINQDHHENGRRAVDMAVGQIKTFRRGRENNPCTTLVAAKMIPIPAECPLKAETASRTVMAS
ncbi:LacI family DNA-binding transcriptional regulator [Pelagicoccus sp. NFK12]|uniref:LacI family DNA-binding transcriptional regulator n=1 Tax=Pelagicoccus enzymogenes TaxID=2773457 RepID=A0A927FA44_9BACT|nr:LacI family DNA-binding transcriptional regulator [Pelagicoccus enzymogenes]MBD5780006.1 LacI family DNA-binding transcriptional regulator [Pelagicoccus enzymogenes]MDQ8198576.1 LacI family DNA-binding transcriptional regulator [Pelagicoccus enzymogenes]